MNDKLLILEDTNGDGRADKCKTFAGDLHNPTGFEFWNGGVIVAQGPRPPVPQRHRRRRQGRRAASASSRPRHGRHAPHGQQLHRSIPAGRSTSRKARSTIRRSKRPGARRGASPTARVFRYEPRSQKFDVYVSYGFANPHGHVFDRWGQDIVVDGTGANPYHAALFSGHVNFPQKHATPPQVYQQRTRPLPGDRVSVEPALPRRDAGQPAGAQRDRLSGHSALQGRRQGRELHRRPSRSRSSPRPTRTSARSISRSAPTARSTSPIGTTRSSATCSTTSAIPTATRSTAASIA